MVRFNKILETKLFLPVHQANLLSRPRLVERLNEGLERKLSLVCAPAGFGKTTLLFDWSLSQKLPVGWVSLDETDNSPLCFWSYFLTALDRLNPGLCQPALALLHSNKPPAIEIILAELFNHIASEPTEYLVVLADYHYIVSQAIHRGLLFALDHQPPQLHLLITTRSDPPIPLARLRSRDQLVELRASDLRFNLREIEVFLNEINGLGLKTADLVDLEERTEGWITGLQLAAISLRGSQDRVEFIKSFTGSHRYIMDYLTEEVLHQQPPEVQQFLLITSILDRMTGPLCDSLTQQANGQTMLKHLERANLFLVPLDEAQEWYRYHRLFAHVLRSYAFEAYSDQIPKLHRRASIWYEENDLIFKAVSHALQAEDLERAVRLLDQLPVPRQNDEVTAQYFMNEGRAIEALLKLALTKGLSPVYINKLLIGLGSKVENNPSPAVANPIRRTKINILSGREQELLQLLASGLSNREISQRLVVSEGTVKVHFRNIYGKLGINNRSQAVIKARELNLV